MWNTLLGIDIMGGGASAPDNMPVPKDSSEKVLLIIVAIAIIIGLIRIGIYLIKNDKTNSTDDEDERE